MAVIRVRGTTRGVPAGPARSILVWLQQAGVPIQTLCGGRARCGKCVVVIHAGTELLSPMRAREIERLREIGAPPGARLACQTHTRGDIEIEILNPEPATPGAP